MCLPGVEPPPNIPPPIDLPLQRFASPAPAAAPAQVGASGQQGACAAAVHVFLLASRWCSRSSSKQTPNPPPADAVRVAKIHLSHSDRYSGLLVVSPISSRVSRLGGQGRGAAVQAGAGRVMVAAGGAKRSWRCACPLTSCMPPRFTAGDLREFDCVRAARIQHRWVKLQL